jgi:TadE-like protein
MTHPITRYRPAGRNEGDRRRRGAAVVEMAIVLMVFITLVLGMLDLGIAVFRRHVIAQAARQGVRQAIVHGGLANAGMGVWGPTAWSGTADSGGHEVLNIIQPMLAGMDPSTVDVQVEWLDGGNDVNLGDHVRVSVSTPYQPIMTFIFGNPTFTLQATSTMQIAH